jgi:triacylglycerol lipase
MVQHRYTPPPLRHSIGRLAGLAGELEATAACVARYPFGLVEGALTTGRPSGELVHDTPVLLVHGYAHNESGWWVLDRRLRQAGFTSIHRLNYLPLGSGIPQLAERLDARVEEICDLTGSQTVHVVGHSMGGILLRWYVQELGGDRRVDTAITLGSPHEGTLAAWLWPERTARDMRPGSSVISRLSAGARRSPVRWVSIYSDADLLIRPRSAARLRAPEMRATNIEVRRVGHLSLLVAPRVVKAVVDQLEAAEGVGAQVTSLPMASQLESVPLADAVAMIPG